MPICWYSDESSTLITSTELMPPAGRPSRATPSTVRLTMGVPADAATDGPLDPAATPSRRICAIPSSTDAVPGGATAAAASALPSAAAPDFATDMVAAEPSVPVTTAEGSAAGAGAPAPASATTVTVSALTSS
jgi:hypothetical protein